MAYFQRNGGNFIPQGANYVPPTIDVNFILPAYYNGAQATTDFQAMRLLTLNSVRIFFWMPNAGNAFGTPGLNSAYLDNAADIIKRAYNSGLYVILSCGGVPPNYLPLSISPFVPAPYTSSLEWTMMDPTGVTTRNQALNDMYQGLASRGVTADMILALELTGEIGFLPTDYPFNTSVGSYTNNWGTYNLATDHTLIAQDAMKGSLNIQTGLMRFLTGSPPSPGAWLTMTQANPEAILEEPTWYIPYNSQFTSNVDAIGLSLYPQFGRTMAYYMGTVFAGMFPTPSKIVTMLETGWYATNPTPIYQLAVESQQWQQAACAYGVYGSSFFTWNLDHATSSSLYGVQYYNMQDTDQTFALALNPTQLGDGCGGGITSNQLITPVTATPKVICHFYAPGKYAKNFDAPIHVSERLLSAKVVVEQVNQFDPHHLEFAIVDQEFLLAMEPFTTVDIEQVGVGIIARGIITAPNTQIDDTYVDKVVMDVPNLTEQGSEINTGVGYIDQQAIKDVASNLGSLGTKGISELVIDNTTPYGYYANGLAHTQFTPGIPDGWAGVYLDDGSYINSSAPVAWDFLANMSANGNTITRIPGTGSGYVVGTNFTCGAVGTPIHTDVTQPCTFQWQIVVPTTLQVGLREDIAINSPMFGFDFVPSNPPLDAAGNYYFSWSIIHEGVGIGVSGTAVIGNSPVPGITNQQEASGSMQFAVSIVQSSGALYAQYIVNGLPVGGLSNGTYQLIAVNILDFAGPFRPCCFVSSANGEVDNAIFSRTVPTSEAWWQVTFNKLSKTEAFIKFAKDTSMFVRLGRDPAGAPDRFFEFGPMNAAATVTLVDPNGADATRMRADSSLRVIDKVNSFINDVSGVYTVATPLGAGSGLAQVDIEYLWRILYDPTFQDFQGRYGYDTTKIFPEYDPNIVKIWRTPTLSQGYEYFITYEPAFAPNGFKAWLQGTPLSDGAFGYKEGGPTSDSTFNYPDSATVSQQEATQRFLYAAYVARMLRAVQPHITTEIVCFGDWLPPRAGDRVHIDYAKLQTDQHSGQGFSTLRVKTGFDELGNPVPITDTNHDPRVMKVIREFNGDQMPMDTFTLSNLGKYEDSDTSQSSSMETAISALQVTQQNALAVSHLNPSFSEIDTDHPVELPFYNLPTMFKMSAFYLYISLGPFRQPVAPDGTTSQWENPTGTQIFVTVDIADIKLPAFTDWSTQNANIGALPTHIHRLPVNAGNKNLTIVQVPFNNPPDRYAWIDGDGNPDNNGKGGMSIGSNGHIGSIPTGNDVYGVDLNTTAHPHVVAQAGDEFIHIPLTTAIGTLPQHTHPLPAGIKELETPAGISVFIDSGDGAYIDRTGALVDVLSGSGPGVSGFAGGVLLEISRFMDSPGKLCRIKLVSTGNGTDGGRGRVAWAGTVMEQVGGLGSIIQQQA